MLPIEDDDATAGAASAAALEQRPLLTSSTPTATPTTPSRTPETPDSGPLLLAPPANSSSSNSKDESNTGGGGPPISPEEYFSEYDLKGRDIGRTPRSTAKVQRFKANLWLSEKYPINLQEQVLPIFDLMSTMASPHVGKLKDFITMQLPAGFPVKIEIPLFHVLNACVTFGNVFALDAPVPNVSVIRETAAQGAVNGAAANGVGDLSAEEAAAAAADFADSDERLTCVIDDSCFDVPAHYTNKSADHRQQMRFEDEDDLLQFAIQQSLLETGRETEQVDIWEALKARRPVTPSNAFGLGSEEEQLQR